MKQFLLLLFFFPMLLLAQSVQIERPRYAKVFPQDTIERNVLLDIHYEQVEVDTVLKDQDQGIQVLQIGQHSSMYKLYASQATDSLCFVHDNRVLKTQWDSVRNRKPRGFSYTISHVRNSSTYLEQKQLLLNFYQAVDTAVVWNWTMHPDTMRVCGYLCHKATAEFRGRIWTAWWAEGLPYSEGPWKLHGLPGVILRASDNKGMHLLEAIKVVKPAMPIIVRRNRMFMTVPYQQFRAILRDYAINPEVMRAASGVSSADGKPLQQRLFYSPYEDE